MTSTPVKDVGSAFMNLTASQGGKNSSESGDFLKVWSNQMSKGAQSNSAWNGLPQGNVKQTNASASQKADVNKPNSNKTDDSQIQQKDSTDMGQETVKASEDKGVSDTKAEQPEQTDELSPEELEEAMEVLNTAAAELVQQIADVFGISMEELQAAMEDLGMDMTDVLDASKLSGLLLNLGGAEDSYALVTDETLYGNYQEMMGSLNETLQDVSEKLDMDRGEVALLLEKASVKEETVSGSAEELKDMPVDVEVSNPAELKAAVWEMPVQETQNQPDEQPDGQEAQSGTQSQTGQIHRQVRQEGDKPDREQPVTMFSQHLEPGQFEPEVQQSGNIPQNTGWSTDTQNIMNQIMDYMKLQLNADTTSLEMQLHPASLGAIQIQLASKAGVVTANFIAQNEAVKTAIESQISQLKESFEEQGVKVEAIEVTVQSHEFERNLEQGRGRQQQEPEKKNRIRRINLDNPMSMENLDEEALAADMLAASGSTVEFTA